MTTRRLILAGLTLAAIVALAIFAEPASREWAYSVLGAMLALFLREADHLTGGE